MNFKNKVTRYFVTAIILPFMILSILSVILFSQSFEDYLEREQTKKFERLEVLTKQLFLNASDTKDLNRFLWYIAEEKVDITFYDIDGNIKYRFSNSVDRSPYFREGEYIRKESNVLRDGQVVGSIAFGYYDESYLNPAAKNFRSNLGFSVALSTLFAAVIGLVLSHYFSTNISDPVLSLSENTELIRSGEFGKLDLPRSDFYEINQLSVDLGYLAKALDLQQRIRKEYAQDISHELRTPITNMQLHLEAMEDGIIPCDEENIRILLAEVHRMNGLIGDLKLSFDRDISEMALDKETFEVSEVLTAITDSIRPRFLRKGVELVYDDDLKIEITSDKEKLRTIVYNLLTNALKATAGSPDAFVHLKLQKTPDKMLIHVVDNGIGMKKEDQAKIFDRFYRVDDARNTKENGYGLGLSIVKNLADLLDLKIIVHSKEGIGSEFILEGDLEELNAVEIIEGEE